jgi:hypothetical protein
MDARNRSDRTRGEAERRSVHSLSFLYRISLSREPRPPSHSNHHTIPTAATPATPITIAATPLSPTLCSIKPAAAPGKAATLVDAEAAEFTPVVGLATTTAVLVTVDPGAAVASPEVVAALLKLAEVAVAALVTLLTGNGRFVALPVAESVGKPDGIEDVTTTMLVPEGVSSVFRELGISEVELGSTTTADVLLTGRLVVAEASLVNVVVVVAAAEVLPEIVELVVVVTTGKGKIVPVVFVGAGGGYGTLVTLVEDTTVVVDVDVSPVGVLVVAGQAPVGVVVMVHGLPGHLVALISSSAKKHTHRERRTCMKQPCQ